jgi:outer membrane protein assembly factor BamB
VDGDMDKGYLRCLEWKTGNSKWTFKDKPASALVAADGKLLVQGVKGELFLGAASPDGFKPMAQAQVLGGKCWTTAVLANGRIYCRNAAGDLVCLDVRGGSGS